MIQQQEGDVKNSRKRVRDETEEQQTGMLPRSHQKRKMEGREARRQGKIEGLRSGDTGEASSAQSDVASLIQINTPAQSMGPRDDAKNNKV
eukprot:179989-Amorphochlora_amoeboformis.AAC.1